MLILKSFLSREEKSVPLHSAHIISSSVAFSLCTAWWHTVKLDFFFWKLEVFSWVEKKLLTGQYLSELQVT